MEADSWFQYLSQRTMLKDSPASSDMAWVFLQPHTTGSTGSNRRQLLLSAHMCLFVYVIVFLFICLCVICTHIMCMFAHMWSNIVWGHTYMCVPVGTRGWYWKTSPIALVPYSIRWGLSVNLEFSDGAHLTSWLDLGIPGLTLRTELEAILTMLSLPPHGLLNQIQSSCLHGKYFNHRSISPIPIVTPTHHV